MKLLGRIRENLAQLVTPPEVDFPVTQIPAAEVRAGMTIVAMPEGWVDIRPDHRGRWPVAIEDARCEENGEGGVPCVYWLSDEPGPWNGYWCYPETPITVAVDDGD